MSGEEWGSQRHLMIHHYSEASTGEIVILINMENYTIDFTLPEGRNWSRVVDTQAWFDQPTDASEPNGYLSEDPTRDPYRSWNIELNDPPAVTDSRYGAQPFSMVILEER